MYKIKDMKRYIFFLLFLFLQQISGCFAQQKNNVFEITKQTSGLDQYIFYSDKDENKYQKVPKFNFNMDLLPILSNALPLNELKKIEKEIFLEEEMKEQGRILIIFKIHVPSGKIVAVSFSTKNRDIDIEKWISYNQRIKNEIVFNVTLNTMLITDGYTKLSYRLFFSSYKE